MTTVSPISVPPLVQWYEGQLLYPQHYQQMHTELEIRGLYYLSISCPWFWGVRSYQIDPALLAAGKVSLKSVDALMPDGSIVQKIEGAPLDISVEVESLKEKISTEPVTLYLAVVARNSGTSVVSGEDARYISLESAPTADLNTGTDSITLALLKIKPFLVATFGVLPSHYVGFPLAKLQYLNNMYTVGEFLPPTTLVSTLPSVMQRFSKLIASMRGQATYLSERIQSLIVQDVGPVFQHYIQIYNILVEQMPALEVLYQAEALHPFTLYRALCTAAGGLSKTSKGKLPPVFPTYDHNNLLANFSPVMDYLEEAVSTIWSPAVAVPFAETNGIFSLITKGEWLQDSLLTVGITLLDQQPAADVIEWIKGAIICSSSVAQSVRERRVLGAERTLVEQVPQLGLVISSRQILAQLTLDKEYIKENDALMIFNPSGTSENQPREIILYVAS